MAVAATLTAGERRMLRSWLLDRVDVVPRDGTDEYAQPRDGTPVKHVACLIDVTETRVLVEGREISADISLQLPPDVTVRPEDKVRNGCDRNGRALFAQARIVRVDDIRHPRHGMVVQTAYGVLA